jgi:SAM-dependent methyltransferase
MSESYHRSQEEWEAILAGIIVGCLSGRQPDEIYQGSFQMVERFERQTPFLDGYFILDVGCGHGRVAIPLTERNVRYLGIDAMTSCVDFARQAFAPWAHIQFDHLNIKQSKYNKDGSVEPRDITLPVESNTVDITIYNSVFTHMEHLDVAARYLSETLRVLKPGGKCWTTWFRSPPRPVSSTADRTVFREADIIELVKPFRVLFSQGGLTTSLHDQWVVLLEKTV